MTGGQELIVCWCESTSAGIRELAGSAWGAEPVTLVGRPDNDPVNQYSCGWETT